LFAVAGGDLIVDDTVVAKPAARLLGEAAWVWSNKDRKVLFGVSVGFCRKFRFWRQNPKIGYQQFNGLQTPKLSKKQTLIGSRALTLTINMMVVDRSGIHRAHKLDATLTHYQGTFRFHFLPAHGGHHLNPMEGFWRVMKDAIGAGRCFPDLHQLYQRTRQVLMAHQERPIYAFHW
jgi:hypothetical protein